MVDLARVSLFGELEKGGKFPFALGPTNSLGGPYVRHKNGTTSGKKIFSREYTKAIKELIYNNIYKINEKIRNIHKIIKID